MNRKSKKIMKRKAVSKTQAILAGVLALNTIGVVTAASLREQVSKHVNAEQIANASGKNKISIDGVSISLDQQLDDNGDGTYKLSLKTSSNLTVEEMSVKATKTEFGYYEAEKAGAYMLEIWGGNGGNGDPSIYSQGGKGGKGAHLWAVANLQAGDILYYTIGGNGQRTLSNDTGGGANGDGGDHGDTGNYYVGGGGGYTAVYQFTKSGGNADSFKSNYLDAKGNLKREGLTNSDRTSKYIMIAGGGGGGGAGNAWSLTDRAIRTPDGGDAGSFDSAYGKHDSSYAVEGTFYAGHDGYSSGKRLDYIGKGGTDKPGEVNKTYIEWFEGKKPNDWAGLNNSKYPGGSGGAGNLRGGAGGAGFAGGSGGIMAGLLVGTDVGGGGGGSSFVASSLVAPAEDQMKYKSDHNTSTTGGAVYISYMPTSENLGYLENLNVQGEISKYFNIVSGVAKDSAGGEWAVTLSGNSFSVDGVKATPASATESGKFTTIELTVKPVDGFMGGNDVPLFNGSSIKYNYVKESVLGSANMGLVEKCSYVNVPYAFDLKTYNYTKSGTEAEPNTELKGKDLFVDNKYVEQMLDGDKKYLYDFIDSVTDYSITSDGATYYKDEVLSIGKTKTFDISYTVRPKTGSKAIVGEKLTQKTYKQTAKVTIVSSSSGTLNDVLIVYKKTLNYDAKTGTYNLALNLSSSVPAYVKTNEGVTTSYDYSTSSSTGTYNVPIDGYYYVQLWGGKGGHGGLSGSWLGMGPNPGGEAGEPGYVGQIIKLSKNDQIQYTLGANGTDGSEGWELGKSGAGVSGQGSYIRVNSTAVLAAGGSGGGGSAIYTRGGSGKKSDDVSLDEAYFNTQNFSVSNINGGSAPSGATNTNACQSGTSYKDAAYYNSHPISDTFDVTRFAQNNYTNVGGGAFHITPLVKVNDVFKDYTIEADFTDDFDLNSIALENATGTKTDSGFTSIQPKVTASGDLLTFDYTITYNLSPADTCDGGLDIKLLNGIKVSQIDLDGNVDNDEFEVQPQDPTDYANVRINPDLLNDFTLTIKDQDYIQGRTGIAADNLYTATNTFSPVNGLAVKTVEEDLSGTVSPTQTTDYKVTYGIKYTGTGSKAVVGPALDPLVITSSARVNVYHEIHYSLDNINVEGPTAVVNSETINSYVPGDDYVAHLTPVSGMELPDEITVKINGTPYAGFTYQTSGEDEKELVIPGAALEADSYVEVIGEAKERTFKLHYLIATDETGYSTQEYTAELTPGTTGQPLNDAIDGLLAHTPTTEIPGYVFVIEFPNGDRSTFTEMPAYDCWINGTYQPEPHSLKINYVYNDGGILKPLPGVESHIEGPDQEISCYNKKILDVSSPEVSGYAPSTVEVVSGELPEGTTLNPARVSFEMPNMDMELNVIYESTASKVIVNYECKDKDIIVPDTYTIAGNVGDTYSVPIPSIPGYVGTVSPEPAGAITAEGESLLVTYSPIQYTIHFNSDITGDYKEFDDRPAFYGHEIGYTLVPTTEVPDPTYEDATYSPLPTPVKVGYDFMGWSYGGNKVDAMTVLNKTSDITLKALWKKQVTEATSENTEIKFSPETFNYDGEEHKPEVQVYVNNKLLEEDVDYQLFYPLDCVSAGEKEVTISFINEYSSGSPMKASYTIKPRAIPSADLEIENISGNIYTYTGEEILPTPYVKDNGVELTIGTDFEYEYVNNIEKGNAKVIIHFLGNYAATPDKEAPFTISARDIEEGGVITVTGVPTTPVTYTGSAIEPTVIVTFTEDDGTVTLLKPNVDYTVVYDDNINAGEATVTVRFINNYEATKDVVKHFIIEGATIDHSKLSNEGIDSEGYTYTGSKIEPSPITITYDGKTLVEGTDFTVDYENNLNVNSPTNEPNVIIHFIGNYEGSEDYKIPFDINPKAIEKPTEGDPSPLSVVPLPTESNPMILHDTGLTPDLSSIVITDNDNKLPLVEGIDYDIIIDDAATGKAHIEFKGNYEGTDEIKLYFVIKAPVVAPIADQKYTGQQLTPAPVVTFNDLPLVENVDYTVSYGTNISVGNQAGSVFVTFINDYADLKVLVQEVKFNIVTNTIDARDLVVSNIDPMTYTGEQLTPTPTVIYNGVTLTNDVDYELSYGENVHAGDGVGKVVITLKDGYSSENKKTVYFDILPKKIEDPTNPDTGLIIEPLPDEFNPMQIPNNGKDPIEFEEIVITDPVTGEELRNPEDFTLVDDGDGDGHIEFHGDYEGTPNVPFKYEVVDPEITSTIEDQPYTGEPIEPEITVTFDGEELEEGVDYIVRYEDNDEVGEAKVIVEFIGDYEGCEDQEITFNIIPTTIDESLVEVADVEDQTYTGSQIKPTPEVKYNGVVLTAGKDYTYSYGENIHAGTDAGSVTISFMGGFTGEDVDKTFNILPKKVNDPTDPDSGLIITPTPDSTNPIKVPPTSGDPTLPITIVDPETNKPLRNPEDFTIEDFNPETGEAVIKFHGDYETTPDVTVYYEVEEIVIDPIDDQEYTGEQSTPVPHITFNGEDLVEGEDYTIDYGDNDETGEGTIIITYIGDFADVTPNPDTITFNIVVNNMDAHDLVVDYIDPMIYTGSQLIPDNVVVKYNGVVLTEDIDYELNYGENIHAGEGNGKVIVSMIGGFESENTKTVYFDILPKEVEDPSNPDTGLIIEPLPDESDPMQIPNNGKDPIEFDEIVITDPVTGEELRNPEDFTLVDYGNGEGHIEFHGDYEGTPDVPFKYEIVDPEIETEIEDQPYTGEPIEPEITVTFDGEELEEGVDYIVRYEDNDEVGEAKVIVEFIGDYEGCEDQEITFNIIPTTIDESLVEVADIADQTYTGSQIKPTPEVKYNGVVLTAGKDFKYNYGENVHAGEDAGIVTIEFIGGFSGNNVEKTFNITPKQITDPDDPDTGLDIDPRPTEEDPIVVPNKGDGSDPDLMPIEIKDKETGETLTNPEDFEIVIDDEEGHAHIEFKGDYEGTPDIPLFYEVQEIKVNIPPQPYSGDEVKPHPEVTFDGETLTEGEDYVVYYSNNSQPGTATAIIQFIGEYSDIQTRTVEFEIKGTRLDNSSTTADGRSTVVILNEDGFDTDIMLYAKLVETVPDEIKDQAALGGRFYGTYGDYEIKLLDKDGNEVQPSDIKEGTVLTLMIELPEELQGRDVKLVHYHSADDISIIVKGDEAGIGTYIITEEGYIVTQINKFSNFSLIYEETCLAHWFMITAAVLNILLIAAIIIMGKKQSKALGIGAIVGLVVMSGVGAIFAHCMICWVSLGINGALVLFDILFFIFWKGKEEPQAPQAQPQVVYVQAPVAQPAQVIVQQAPVQAAPAPVAQPAPVEAELTLHDSMEKAAATVAQLKVTKEIVANYLTATYKEKVVVNRKANFTKTGLPLADTHYVNLSEGKKTCVLYVYELEEGSAFIIAKTDEATAKAIQEKHELVVKSLFPHTNDGGLWFSILFDDSYKSIEDVYEVIDQVVKGYLGEKKAPAPVEINEELTLHDSMEKAAAVKAELKVNKEVVANYLTEAYKDNVIVNRKANYTKTGLPLADTHYVKLEKNVCVMYVYELNDGASFLIVKTSDDVAAQIKAKHPLVAQSLFPHTNDGGKWFTVMFDESYADIKDVHEVIDMVINGFDKNPAPKKAEEPKPVVVEEPAPVEEMGEDGINYMYKFSFSARLIRAGEERQNFYNEIKNEFLSYKKVNSKISWGHELFKLGRNKLGQMKVKGKTLCVYLPLDPKKYDQERLWFKETGDEEFPMMMQVKSDRAVKYVKELIADVMANSEIPHMENYEAQDYRLPEMTIEEMLNADPQLAKLVDGAVMPVVEKKAPVKAKKVEKPEPAPVLIEPEDDNSIAYAYKLSFSARLIRAGADRQDLYNAMKNDILSYKKVASKISWGHELFKLGRIKLAQFKVKGKTLCVYLPLDPSKYDKDRLFFQDLRVKGKEVEFPMMMKVKSDRAVKYVAELIADVMANNEIIKNEKYEIQDYKLPEMSMNKMLKEGLVKENNSKVSYGK